MTQQEQNDQILQKLNLEYTDKVTVQQRISKTFDQWFRALVTPPAPPVPVEGEEGEDGSD